MKHNIKIRKADPEDVPQVVDMVGALLQEIMQSIGVNVFDYNTEDATLQLEDFLNLEKYHVFLACEEKGKPVGMLSVCESCALYAGGVFGMIPELYVYPDFRCQKVGHALIEQTKAFGRTRNWKRLEVTTPPLPQYDKTLAFYEREGFAITGGRKLKVVL
ncbi:MAG: GNAT family N-acetyltransferase [Magnetococcales bacterium]|nr:GNAT family N-acetyltransferase [Magnetococcales bacterium]